MIHGDLLDEVARLGGIAMATKRLVNAISDVATVEHQLFHVPDAQVDTADLLGLPVQRDLEMVSWHEPPQAMAWHFFFDHDIDLAICECRIFSKLEPWHDPCFTIHQFQPSRFMGVEEFESSFTRLEVWSPIQLDETPIGFIQMNVMEVLVGVEPTLSCSEGKCLICSTIAPCCLKSMAQVGLEPTTQSSQGFAHDR